MMVKAISPIHALIKALQDSDEQVRCQAAWGLYDLADEQTIEPLIAALQSGFVCNGILWALAKMKSPKAIAPLLALWEESADNSLRCSIMSILAQIGDASLFPFFVSRYFSKLDCYSFVERVYTVQGLGQSRQPEAVSVLFYALQDESDFVRTAAVNALLQIGDDSAIALLTTALRDADDGLRQYVAGALTKLGWTPRSIEEQADYYAAVHDWDRCVKIGPPAIVPLANGFRSDIVSRRSIKVPAARALARMCHPAAVDKLITIVSKDDRIPSELARVLADERLFRIIPPLVATLYTSDEWARPKILHALSLLLMAAMKEGNSYLENAANLDDIEDVKAIRQFIYDFDKWVRRSVVNIWPGLAVTWAKVPLLQALQAAGRDIPPDLERAEMRDLGRFATVFQQDVNENIRLAAAEADRRMNDPQLVEPLLCAVLDKEPDVRRATAEALGKMGNTRAIDGLAQLLEDRWEDVRSDAIKVLGHTDREQAATLLIDALQQDTIGRLRREVARVLTKVGDRRAIDPLLNLIAKGGESYDLDSFVEALVKIGGKQVVEPFIRFLNHPSVEVRWAACTGLGELGDSQAVAPLIAALDDENMGVHNEAIFALLRIETAGKERRKGPYRYLRATELLYEPDEVLSLLERLGTPEALSAAEKWRSQYNL